MKKELGKRECSSAAGRAAGPVNAEEKETGAKWLLSCGNAFVDGMIINDFFDDAEAAEYAANYEATCYRIDPDGSRTVIYTPGNN